ncbi:hypothetical protein HK101_006167, partial [Irineochytrium annulatum]
IGVVLPFSAPLNLSDPFSVEALFGESISSVREYNLLLWLVNRTNNDPTVLPNTKLELVPVDSRWDAGRSLLQTLAIIDQGVAAIIGESTSRNTVTMGLAAAVNNVLHCAGLASTPQLSDKNNYPTSFRTLPTAIYQVRAMFALVRKFNLTTVGAIVSDDDFGQGMVQEFNMWAPYYNITVKTVVSFAVASTSCVEQLQTLMSNNIQVILVAAAQSPAVNVYASAAKLGMYDGSHWFIGSQGWTESLFLIDPIYAEILPMMRGVWQIAPSLPSFNSKGEQTQELKDMNTWYNSMFYPDNSPTLPGTPKTFKLSYVAPYKMASAASNCPANDPQLNISSAIVKLPFQMEVGNTTMLMGFAGNMCMGDNLQYLDGYQSVVGNKLGFKLPPDPYMYTVYNCGKTFVSLFDKLIKNGNLTVADINNRLVTTLRHGNLSQIVNYAGATDAAGNVLRFNEFADLDVDQDI